MLPDVDPLHRGARFDRTDTERSNPRERVFAEEWNRMNTNDPRGWSLLDKLINEEGRTHEGYPNHTPVAACTERDHMIAASVIQWLGSNVGQGFLEAVKPKAEAAYAEWKKQHDESERKKILEFNERQRSK